MMVSEMLWVGSGPDKPSFGMVVHCSSAPAAKAEMDRGNTVVVPTRDVAKDVLRLLGCGEAWVAFAVGGIGVIDPEVVL